MGQVENDEGHGKDPRASARKMKRERREFIIERSKSLWLQYQNPALSVLKIISFCFIFFLLSHLSCLCVKTRILLVQAEYCETEFFADISRLCVQVDSAETHKVESENIIEIAWKETGKFTVILKIKLTDPEKTTEDQHLWGRKCYEIKNCLPSNSFLEILSIKLLPKSFPTWQLTIRSLSKTSTELGHG